MRASLDLVRTCFFREIKPALLGAGGDGRAATGKNKIKKGGELKYYFLWL